MIRKDHQIRGVESVKAAILRGCRRICLTSPTGMGKCLGRGTPVLMYDGLVKLAEEIVEGDLLMGPDSEPRTVLGTVQGDGPLYRIDQINGDSYVVNDVHILSLKLTKGVQRSLGKDYEDGEIIDISVLDYVASSKTFKHCAKGFRVGVNFTGKAFPGDPYFLGLWLGDGTQSNQEVTTADPEIVDFLKEFAESYGLRLVEKEKGKPNKAKTYALSGEKWKPNPVRNMLRNLGVMSHKHVPHIYKTACRAARLAILAGLIDSDGSLHANSCYDVVFKNRTLAEDTAFLGRSLGFHCYLRKVVKECCNNGMHGTYWRISVVGDVDEIPVKVPHKKSGKRRQKKDHLVHGITATRIGRGAYYGFELDGDGRFLLGDFTVTHNSLMAMDIADWYLERDKRVSFYTNRKLLAEQMAQNLRKAGVAHGIRAAGHVAEHDEPLQISSIQTEHSRCVKRKTWELHPADLVIVDEAHLFGGKSALEIIYTHLAMGAVVVGLTATPIDLADVYHELVVAGTNSEGRSCGLLLPALHYGPDEPDLKHIGKVALGEDLSEAQNVKAIMTHGVFGRVYESWKRLNPGQTPTILFAPGVKESVWFAQQFFEQGIPSAHIDGEEVWINGNCQRSNPELRSEILAASRDGRIRVLCNRFVLREGIDAPWLSHGIFATVFGSLQSYLQSGGRLLRYHPGDSRVVIQDHGGNWHRHGSLNADRTWELSDTASIVAGRRTEQLRNSLPDSDGKPPREPVRCPQCGLILASWKCQCGFRIEPKAKSRPVIQSDGTLKQMRGDIFRPRETKRLPDTAIKWQKCFFRARNSKKKMTFNQAIGLFFHENGYWPPADLRGMPRDRADLFKAVAAVPADKLYS